MMLSRKDLCCEAKREAPSSGCCEAIKEGDLECLIRYQFRVYN
ncbi:hypothetical protein HanPI659440_Chr08g0294431 [Helianthus annuus]|nr:hypothetical protein HanPI659440_Chr08g0294431 [Helianthus annuus]